ncbi:MAG TPA: methyltransferase domain-containing protein [Roseiflexaceae bacterium]|jgi:ubiquinone/menaquinone biosynthesis C-methylase UbiE|nr:methyltransferase domain-containing protein [Roseiflexaceae bacterium]
MMRRRARWLVWLGGLLGAKVLLSLAIQLWPVPTPPWARRLLHSRWRRCYRDPAQTLQLLPIQPGMRVLELGTGSGLFTAEAARMVGAHGQLLSVDLQPAMLRPVQQQFQQAGLQNVLLSAATAEHLPLPDNSVDLVFAIAVLPMIRDKPQALREARRVLSPAGVLAVSEELIEPEYVPAFVTRRWCRRAGFTLTACTRTRWWYMLHFRPCCETCADSRERAHASELTHAAQSPRPRP